MNILFNESRKETEKRFAKATKNLVENEDQCTLVITHGFGVHSITDALTNKGFFNTPICCLEKLILQNGKWEIELHADDSHYNFDNSKNTSQNYR